MTTIERLNELVAQGDLIDWSSPLQPLIAKRRQFWVTKDVREGLDLDPWPSGFFERPGHGQDRRVRTHTMINQFIEGQNLTMGIRKENADLKCLAPMTRVADWRVWEMRPWKERRLTRVFGEFAAPDVFVALKIMPRKLIGDWDRVAGSVDAEWIRLFRGEQPLLWNAPPKLGNIGRNYSYV